MNLLSRIVARILGIEWPPEGLEARLAETERERHFREAELLRETKKLQADVAALKEKWEERKEERQ